jgi:hypothetical protein
MHRVALAAGTALLLSLSVVVGTAGAASAAGYRTWTISGVTFDDGGQMSGSFRLSDTGEMSAVHVTTSGGHEGVFGASTTYDDTNSFTMDGFAPNDRIVAFESRSRYVLLAAGVLTAAEDGDVRALDNASYECDNCTNTRRVSTGTLVAGTFVDTSQVTLTGTPGINGTPRVGQTLTGDDSSVTTSPSDATRSYQWLRDGDPIAGQNGATYAATADDIGSTMSFRVGATKEGHPDATPVDSAGLGPIEALPSQVTLTGTPGINGTPQVGQTLTGDDSSVTTSPSDATRSYQWLRDGDPIAGQSRATYTATADDIGSTVSFRVGATKAGHPDATPVDSAGIGPIEALPSTPLPSTTIKVLMPSGLHLGGRPVRVTASGLEANEAYTVGIGGVTIGSGTAPASGALSRMVVVPRSIGDRRAAVRVAGTNRAGTASLRVVQAKRLGLALARPALHKRQRQLITVTGLAAGERVKVKYRNRVVSPATARATAAGGYRTVVRVGRLAGTKTITATGEFRSRYAVRTCQVTRRH